jgi:cytochrome d ubiquinol oxidase subunit I
VTSIFFAFRLMVAIGLTLVAIGLVGAVLWWRKKLFTTKWYLHIVARAWWLGFIAILAGWLTTESGRQPYVVYGILRTADALSPVSSAVIATSLTLFVLVYCVVFSIGIFYIHRLIWNGPKGAAVKPTALPEGLPNRPLSVADHPARETSGKTAEPPGQATHQPGEEPRPFGAGGQPLGRAPGQSGPEANLPERGGRPPEPGTPPPDKEPKP